jgi:hypothetical protein
MTGGEKNCRQWQGKKHSACEGVWRDKIVEKGAHRKRFSARRENFVEDW